MCDKGGGKADPNIIGNPAPSTTRGTTGLFIAEASESEHVVGDRPTTIDHDWPNMDSLNNVAATVSAIADINATGRLSKASAKHRA